MLVVVLRLALFYLFFCIAIFMCEIKILLLQCWCSVHMDIAVEQSRDFSSK